MELLIWLGEKWSNSRAKHLDLRRKQTTQKIWEGIMDRDANPFIIKLDWIDQIIKFRGLCLKALFSFSRNILF